MITSGYNFVVLDGGIIPKVNGNLANNESLLIAKLAVIYICVPTRVCLFIFIFKQSKGFMSLHDLENNSSISYTGSL